MDIIDPRGEIHKLQSRSTIQKHSSDEYMNASIIMTQ